MTTTAPSVPGDELEEMLLGLYREVLGAPELQATDNIFRHRAHSLLLLQLQSRLSARGWRLPLAALFQNPTVQGVRAVLPRQAGSSAAPQAEEGQTGLLSPAEERMWFLSRLSSRGVAYNVTNAIELFGELDATALARAIGELTRRHEVLRTRFVSVEGSPRRVVDPWRPFMLAIENLDGDPSSALWEKAEARLGQEARRPFDFEVEHPIRALLVRGPERWNLLSLTIHHIATDDVTLRKLLDELALSYNAHLARREPSLTPLPLRYQDHVRWQRRQIEAGDYQADVAYWKEKLAGVASLRLPRRSSRPGASETAVVLPFDLPAGAVQALRAFCQQRETTMFVAFLALHHLLMRALTGQPDLVVGAPVRCRPFPETEGVVGLFVNTIALRIDSSGAPSFAALVEEARRIYLEASAHQEVPFDLVARAVAGEGTPLVQTMLAYHEGPFLPCPVLDGLRSGRSARPLAEAKFELALCLANEGGALTGELEYDVRLFDRATASRWAGHVVTLLVAAMERPERPLEEMLALVTEPLAGAVATGDQVSAPVGGPSGSYPALLAIYRDVLEVPALAETDNIFAHGAHSILLLRLHERLRAATDRELALETLFIRPSVQSLGDFLAEGR